MERAVKHEALGAEGLRQNDTVISIDKLVQYSTIQYSTVQYIIVP